MSAAILAKALRALVPFASEYEPTIDDSVQGALIEARDVLREAAPCDGCGGSTHCGCDACKLYVAGGVLPHTCERCSGLGFTAASIDSAIAQAEERERLDAAVLSLLPDDHKIHVETAAKAARRILARLVERVRAERPDEIQRLTDERTADRRGLELYRALIAAHAKGGFSEAVAQARREVEAWEREHGVGRRAAAGPIDHCFVCGATNGAPCEGDHGPAPITASEVEKLMADAKADIGSGPLERLAELLNERFGVGSDRH